MSTRPKGASVFAHLNPRADGGDDDDTDARRAEGDGEGDPEEDGDADKPKGKQKAGRRADDDPDDDQTDENAAEDGDDDTDAEDERDDNTASARARERGRCAAIFRSAAAGRNPAAAAELAFGTAMPRAAAIRVLSAMAATSAPAPAARQARGHGALRQRMLDNPGARPMAPGGEQAMTPGQRMVARNAARRDRKPQ
ncbi:hypothetical protein HLH33_12950 [Gluconacetobacter diazotrophicus]|uniref:Uncharacterized protein n=1 Tax=Gluconacetobacter diazotrophicus TaxID=33996 RepID=A0A7W4I6M8_GLUDI|nr:hypothetical protein [Gluconacetobacter diazotrophicus]MBB2157207.1 hypothetical protein [Gluconacetobacter diazotrophicus]